MTTDEMIESLQSLLGDIGTVMDSTLLTELKLAQIKAERSPELPWFLFLEETTTTTIDEPRVELPTGFLRETEESHYFVVTTTGEYIALKKEDLATLRSKYEDEESGLPEYYAILGSYLWCYPKPDAEYTVSMHYASKDSTLATGDSGNLWSTYYPDLLIGLAGQSACTAFRALDIKPRFDEMAALAAQQIITDNVAREMTNREDSYGGG